MWACETRLGAFSGSRRGGTVYGATKFAVPALTEGLRMEHKSDNIRCTLISPGAVATELPESSSEEATRKNLREFYKMAIPSDSVARAIVYAIEQPAEVDVNEIVIRLTRKGSRARNDEGFRFFHVAPDRYRREYGRGGELRRRGR